MASSIFDDAAKQNWISVLLSLSCLAEGVKPYTRDEFAKLHAKFQGLTRHIHTSCSSAKPCSCKPYLNDWCQICEEWREIISKAHAHKCYGSDWSKVNSSKWPSDSLEVEKCFHPDWCSRRPVATNQDDISVILGKLINCNDIRLALSVNPTDMRKIGNNVAHETDISTEDKEQYCEVMMNFLKDPVIWGYQEAKESYDKIKLFKEKTYMKIITEKIIAENDLNKYKLSNNDVIPQIEAARTKDISTKDREEHCEVMMNFLKDPVIWGYPEAKNSYGIIKFSKEKTFMEIITEKIIDEIDLNKYKDIIALIEAGYTEDDEETNYFHLYYLCQKIATQAVRFYFDSIVPRHNLELFLMKHKSKITCLENCYNFTKEQMAKLFPVGQVVSTDFDFTLLYKLIRNLLTTIPAPTCGWGNQPSHAHLNETDDIERIRLFRNCLAHNSKFEICDADFSTHWTELSQVINRLSKGRLSADVESVRTKMFDNGMRNEMEYETGVERNTCRMYETKTGHPQH